MLKAWKTRAYLPSTGVLISFGSKKQILEFVNRIKKEGVSFSCFTGRDDINNLGDGISASGMSPVLITTHQMIRTRTQHSSFENAKEFFFRDKHRGLRIWDEGLLIADSASMRVVDLQSLASSLLISYAGFAEDVVSFATSNCLGEVGDSFVVPEQIARAAAAILRDDEEHGRFGRASLGRKDKRTLAAIAKAGGSTLRLGEYGGMSSRALVGPCSPLPDDFAPVVILDASARVRGTYQLWENSKDNLIRLTVKANDYRNLQINLWRIGCGKDALADPARSRLIFSKAAKAVERTSATDCLIIGEKASERVDVLASVKSYIPETSSVKTHFLHWGAHMATNEFGHVRHAVVIGAFDYGRMGYDALKAAALGENTPGLKAQQQGRLRKSEYKHNLLQAVMRTNARNAQNGVCGECVVYVVVNTSITAKDIEDTFPGCSVTEWMTACPRLSGKKAEAIAYLDRRFLADPSDKVSKGDVTKWLGASHSFVSRFLDDIDVKEALKGRGITLHKRNFYKEGQAGPTSLSISPSRSASKLSGIEGAGLT